MYFFEYLGPPDPRRDERSEGVPAGDQGAQGADSAARGG